MEEIREISIICKSLERDAFLENLCKIKEPVAIYLINGIRLQGYVSGFDTVGVLLSYDNVHQWVYNSAISTIIPSAFIKKVLTQI